jgi:hypothetical protein
VSRDLAALALANAALVAAGHGVLRLLGLRPALSDLAWSLAVAYLAGAAAFGVLGSAALVLGLELARWQIIAGCGALLALGFVRRDGLATPEREQLAGWLRIFPVAVLAVLAVLAIDLVVQPVWSDDAWAIWAGKAESIVVLGGLDPDYLAAASVLNASYPLVVPVLELVAYRFAGLPNELVPLQLGLLFLAFPYALVALLRGRVRALLAWTVALAVAAAPTLQIQTATAVADVPLAVFFALAGLAGWRWVEEGARTLLLLAGLFAAAAVGTKVEGRVFVLLLGIVLAVAAARHRRPLRELALVAAAVAASALPWVLWARTHEIADVFSAGGGLSPGGVGRIPSATASLLWELADPSSWLVVVGLAAAAVVVALTRASRREAGLYTLLVTLGSLAAMVAVYWVTPLDFDYHVATSVRRVVTAPVLFAAALTPLLLSRQAAR